MRFDSMPVAPAFSVGGSRFAEEYSRGSLPCHIDHGSFKNRLTWDVPSDELRSRRDGLLVLCAEGLRETRHPFATIARLAFLDLVGLDGCGPLDDEALRRVMGSLRLALLAEPTDRSAASPKVGAAAQRDGTVGVFENALGALVRVAHAEGARLTPLLHLVLPPIVKHAWSRPRQEMIQDALRDIVDLAGPEAAKAMRARGIALARC